MKIKNCNTMREKVIVTFICLVLGIISVNGSIQNDPSSEFLNIAQGDSLESNEQIHLPFSTSGKERVTGAVSVIDPSKLFKNDSETDVSEILRGRIPGKMNGLNLRGVGEALVVIDGLPRPISSVRVEEIEQITVLKDANAAFLYGSQGRNGVILITTKRGKVDSRRFSVSAEHGYGKTIKLPEFLNAADYMLLYNEARTNDGLEPLYSNTTIENTRNRMNPLRYPDADYFGSEFLNSYKPNTRVVAEFSDGKEFAQYYVNAGFTQSGTFVNMGEGQNEHDQRFNVRSNINFNINDFIKSYVGIAAIYDISRRANGNFWADASNLRPNLYPPLIDTSLVPGHQEIKESATLINGRYLLGGNSNYLNNLWGNLNLGGYSTQFNTSFQFNTGIEFDLKSIINGLTLKTAFALDYYNQYAELQNNTYAVYEPQWNVGESGEEVFSLIKRGVDKFEGTQGISDPNVVRNLGFNGMLDYSKIFPNHALSVSLLLYGEQKNQTGLIQPYKNTHLGSKINYMLKNKYIIDVNGMLINSAKLHESNRVGFSPSVGLGWVISNEDFISNNSIINHLKLTATASRLLTDITIPGYYLYDSQYAQSGGVSWNDNSRSLPVYELLFERNYDLFFEAREELNIGLEGLLFDRTLYWDLNLFSTRITDMISQKTSIFSDYLGGIYPYENFGENAYKGIEVGINWNTSLTQDLELSVGSSLTMLETEVVKTDEIHEYDYLYRTGNRVNAIYGLEALGLFTDT
ncbi:MAG TPA: TonB-dependent receptor plug domain-containing protein, partial [Mariniphaga sp.]|nr:TonB-dependent receptor plug domain-containing protein [Mariniphaga sp.]